MRLSHQDWNHSDVTQQYMQLRDEAPIVEDGEIDVVEALNFSLVSLKASLSSLHSSSSLFLLDQPQSRGAALATHCQATCTSHSQQPQPQLSWHLRYW